MATFNTKTTSRFINGYEVLHYVNKKWASLPYYPQHIINQFLKEGWVKESGDLYVKTELEPIYSLFCKNIPKCIGEEPRDSNFSVHNCNTYTRYYSVPKEDYDAMLVKPELTEQAIPSRYHNFDGFTECIQKGKNGMGWVETNVMDYHTTFRSVFFVED